MSGLSGPLDRLNQGKVSAAKKLIELQLVTTKIMSLRSDLLVDAQPSHTFTQFLVQGLEETTPMDVDNRLARQVWIERLTVSSAVAALAFSVFDFILTLGDEVNMIWPQNRRSPTKWIFFANRYAGIIAQVVLTFKTVIFTEPECSRSTTRMLYTLNILTFGIVMACTQAVLTLRAYAIHRKDSRIAVVMSAILLAELAAFPGAWHLTAGEGKASILCMKSFTTRECFGFGAIFLLPQLSAIGLSSYRLLSHDWKAFPIANQVLQDDACLLSVNVSAFILTSALSLIDKDFNYVMHWWLLAVYPATGTRMILNIHQNGLRENHCHHSSADLSSCMFSDLLLVSNANSEFDRCDSPKFTKSSGPTSPSGLEEKFPR
ncbi:hypothetical protein CPB83DRAFT_881645 [Crepidotus variabilis]|uniref:DUF6533 domain-containing protein n=1 Tax=Crepidotus variabilis TaxID=179855 RepID=A0A9P6ELS4_9AGAR|nr:hypothetical protein CPB83DRAFT_881645 [Crepidotus variabilis]